MSESNGSTNMARFKLKRKREAFSIEDEHSNLIEVYLEELDGFDRDDWVNESLSRSKYDRETGARIGYNVKDLEAKMVHKCLFKADGTKFTFNEVQKFPASTLSGMYRMCEELNAVTAKAREEVKKD